MKGKNSSLLWVFVALFASAFNAGAQDDLYYNPSTDASTQTINDGDYREENNLTRRYEDDDEAYYYEDDDDYAYEYSSRIRRFHRPSYSVDYYDPFFVDLYNYDPFYSPGTTIYVYNYNDYWNWRRWRRWNRWNSWNAWNSWGWGAGWNSWGWNSCYAGYQPWYNPWAVNNFYYDPYWTWNGYNPYHNNAWVSNHYYYNNNNNQGGGGYQPQTYTGVRRHGSSVNPGYARIPDGSGRLTTGQKDVPIVAKPSRLGGRTAGDIDPASAKPADRTPSTANGRRPAGMDNGNARGVETPRAAEKPRTGDASGRTPSEAAPRRSSEPATRSVEPSRRGNDAATPSRSNEEARQPARSSEPRPSRRDDSGYTPRRTEPAQESRPARRAEERPAYSPSRSTESRPSNSGSTRSSESRPSSSPRSIESGSSGRSSSPSNSGGGGRSSSGGGGGDKGSKSGGGGGRRQ